MTEPPADVLLRITLDVTDTMNQAGYDPFRDHDRYWEEWTRRIEAAGYVPTPQLLHRAEMVLRRERHQREDQARLRELIEQMEAAWRELPLDRPGEGTVLMDGNQLGRLLQAWEEAYRILARIQDPDLAPHLEGMRESMKEMAEAFRGGKQNRHERLRQARLLMRRLRRPQDTEMAGTGCSIEGCRKPARVLLNGRGLCKVHARQAGELPHGKIGAA